MGPGRKSPGPVFSQQGLIYCCFSGPPATKTGATGIPSVTEASKGDKKGGLSSKWLQTLSTVKVPEFLDPHYDCSSLITEKDHLKS